MMIMMMMNCFCGMFDRRKAFSLISRQDHCQGSSPSRISTTVQAGFEPAVNLSSGFVEWSCAVVLTSTPRRYLHIKRAKIMWLFSWWYLGQCEVSQRAQYYTTKVTSISEKVLHTFYFLLCPTSNWKVMNSNRFSNIFVITSNFFVIYILIIILIPL